jgi:hypothetical protein
MALGIRGQYTGRPAFSAEGIAFVDRLWPGPYRVIAFPSDPRPEPPRLETTSISKDFLVVPNQTVEVDL